MELFEALVVMPAYGWRTLLGLSAIPFVLFSFAGKWIPESPRYHVLSGQPEKAMNTLEHIARVNKKPLPRGTLTGMMHFLFGAAEFIYQKLIRIKATSTKMS